MWEISPYKGCSTVWILQALRDNHRGRLYSFDVANNSSPYIPQDLNQLWKLIIGDFKLTYASPDLPNPDYVFLDSYHSAEFGMFYTRTLFPFIMLSNKNNDKETIPVSLHDVFHPGFWADGVKGRDVRVYPDFMANEEGLVVVEWLAFNRDATRVFTFATSRVNYTNNKHFATLLRSRAEVLQGLTPGRINPTLFFELHRG